MFSTFPDPLTPPRGNVYTAYEGQVLVEDKEVLRVREATVRLGQTIGRFQEVGRRASLLFGGNRAITGSIRRAFVNAGMINLVVGQTDVPSNVDDVIGGSVVPGNTALTLGTSYPIAVSIKLAIREELPNETPNQRVVIPYAFLNTFNLTIARDSELNEAVDFIGSGWQYERQTG